MAPKLEEVCIVKNVFIFDKIYLGLYMGLSQHLDISCGVISTKKLNLFVINFKIFIPFKIHELHFDNCM